MEYFCLAERLVVLDEPLYYYLHNPASVTRNYLPDYMDTFRTFLEAKRALVHRYGLEKDDPGWADSTCWAGLLIAIGNEYAPGNPAASRDQAPPGGGLHHGARYGPRHPLHPAPGPGQEQTNGGGPGLQAAVLAADLLYTVKIGESEAHLW